jgi:hypothetical protein
VSEATLKVLARRGYDYDCTTFPNFLNPLARAYFLATTQMTPEERRQRQALFGSWRDGLRPVKAYRWALEGASLIEIPVTTMPIFKVPIHFSYVLFLWTKSPMLARAYFQTALALCRLTATHPSLLLHPLDFMGREDDADLAFFPAMRSPREEKLNFLGELVDAYSRAFRILTVGAQAAEMALAPPAGLKHRKPRFQGVG